MNIILYEKFHSQVSQSTGSRSFLDTADPQRYAPETQRLISLAAYPSSGIELIAEIATVAVVVSNAKKAKEWFRDKLGFEVKEDGEHWIVVAPPGSKTGIHLCQMGELEPGNQGILFYADDIDATCEELKEKGVEFTRPLGKAEWDENMRYAMFKDLDGNEYWLMPKME